MNWFYVCEGFSLISASVYFLAMEIIRVVWIHFIWSYRWLLVTMWVLPTEFRFSARATSAFNHQATSEPLLIL